MRIRSGEGEMLHEFGEGGLLSTATPDIHDGTIYMLVEFFSKQASAVCALRHPYARLQPGALVGGGG